MMEQTSNSGAKCPGLGPITKMQNAKDYLEESKVPEMFRSLLAALMVQRPADPLEYLDTKLEEIKMRGLGNIDWESFIYNLHPTRDPLHCQLVQDGTAQPPTDDMPPYEEYKPEVFQLTEQIE